MKRYLDCRKIPGRVAMGTVICWLLVGVSFCILVLRWVSDLADMVASTTMISVSILFLLGLITLVAIKRSGYPLSFYGLNFYNWQRVHVEAVIYSIPLLIRFYPGMANSHLLDWSHSLKISPLQLGIDITMFALFTPVQEFIARGGVQSSLQSFLTGKHKNLYAILVANLMFSITHIHLSTVFAIIVFLPGLLWGWMYNRQNTLVGVCISHTIISLCVYYVIGFQELL